MNGLFSPFCSRMRRVERCPFLRVFLYLEKSWSKRKRWILSRPNLLFLLVEQEKIVVLDYGSQYNQLITRTIREFGVYSELHPHTITVEEIKKMNTVRDNSIWWSCICR